MPVQVEQYVYVYLIPFVTAIVFLLNCIDFACNGLYDCEIIIDRLSGVVDVEDDRCSDGCLSLSDGNGGDVDKRYELLFRPFFERY